MTRLDSRKARNQRRFSAPMQLLTHLQWWSNFATHLQVEETGLQSICLAHEASSRKESAGPTHDLISG